MLPPEQRPFLHNYAVLGALHRDQYQFLRYLIDQRSLLQVGPGKNLIVLGLTYLDSGPGAEQPGAGFVAEMVQRHGLYDYRPDTGFSDRPLWPITRFLRSERYRSISWVRALLVGDSVEPRKMQRPLGGAYTADDIAAARDWAVHVRGMGPELAEKRTVQIQYVRDMIQLGKSRGAGVLVVLLPLASWNRAMPVADDYADRITALCRESDIPLADLRWQLADNYFGDYVHPSFQGTQIITPVLANLALQHWQASKVAHADKR